jgi:phosphoenolpyruvate-protein phosphotransferase (PTS system enzyme I)
MSFSLYGIGVSRGIAIGRAHLISHTSLEVAHYEVPAAHVDAEIARFDAALATVRAELQGLSKNAPASAAPEFGAFINLHLMLLNDPMLAQTPRELIARQHCNAEWALKQQMDSVLEEFERIEDSYLRERGADVTQVVERVLKALLGQPITMPKAQTRAQDTILVARDLSPADVMVFRHHAFAGFITDLGGATSHTAILARSMNIASVVALHHAWELVREDELIIVDGTQGAVIVNPDKSILAEYRLKQEQWDIERQRLKRLRTTKAETLCGTRIDLQANIESPDEVDEVQQAGATGIGLYRSEFLFLGRDDLPGEEEQFEAYRRVAEALKPYPVTIRTLDLGADKTLNAQAAGGPNPALGLRAIRYCLAEPLLFNTQLRAILRASHYGKVQLLLPMLSNATELRQSLEMIEAAKQQLREENLPFDDALPIGGMVEVPAVALSLPAFVEQLDFLSIGTNDLIQYTLAIDRTDDSVAYLYNPLHPAVLWLVAHVIRSANRAKIPVAVCGEMAGDATLTRLLLGFGLKQFSMHPGQLPAVKQRVLQTDLEHARGAARRILSAQDSDKIQLLLERLNA